MKQRIILGFFVIVALLAKELNSQSNDAAEECVPFPESWTASIVECADDLTLVQFRELFDSSTEDEVVKCFSKCFYSRIGHFKDGQVSAEAVNEFANEHITHSLLEDYKSLSAQAAATANTVEGEECDKAYKFWLLNGHGELRYVQEDIFCPANYPPGFADRFKLHAHK